ncbi:MAG: Flp family type IVb pilin, partial [Sphaerobacteraceae bacterium]
MYIDLYVPSVETEDQYEGQGMVEYGLILALVSVVAIVALLLLGPAIADIFDDVTDELGGAGGG